MLRLLILLLALTIPPPARADAELFHAAGVLRSRGVSISDDSCPPSTIARYAISSRRITFCPDAITSVAMLREAMAHEVVHAVQHCIAIRRGEPHTLHTIASAIDGEGLTALLTLKRITHIQRGAVVARSTATTSIANSYRLELEAYALESRLDIALNFFIAYC